MEPFLGRNPPGPQRLHQDKRLGETTNQVDALLHTIGSMIPGVDKSGEIQGKQVHIDPIPFFFAALHGFHLMGGNARQQSGGVYRIDHLPQAANRVPFAGAINALRMDNAKVYVVLDEKGQLLLVAFHR